MIFLICTDPPAPPAAAWGGSGAQWGWHLLPLTCTLTESGIGCYLLFGSLLSMTTLMPDCSMVTPTTSSSGGLTGLTAGHSHSHNLTHLLGTRMPVFWKRLRATTGCVPLLLCFQHLAQGPADVFTKSSLSERVEE